VNKQKQNFLITVIVAAIIGASFLFPSKQFLQDNNLLLGLTYNDHVMVGTLAFILATAALYKLILLTKSK